MTGTADTNPGNPGANPERAQQIKALREHAYAHLIQNPAIAGIAMGIVGFVGGVIKSNEVNPSFSTLVLGGFSAGVVETAGALEFIGDLIDLGRGRRISTDRSHSGVE